jgi:HPt (histidine-containing phosphotransfer) domain-containing protein
MPLAISGKSAVQRTELYPGQIEQPATEELSYDAVRLSFLVRLHSEETRLEALCEALASAKGNRVPAFIDLQVFAHRLHGAASLFGLPEIRDAAKDLEQSSAVAATSNATRGEPLVQDTIRTLAARLTCLNGFTADSRISATPTPAN